MQISGQTGTVGGGWGGDHKTPLPVLTFREKPPARPSPTAIRFPEKAVETLQEAPRTPVKGSPRAGMKMPDGFHDEQRMPREKLIKAIDMYEAGDSLSQIGKALDVAKSTIYRNLKDSGVKLRAKKEIPPYLVHLMVEDHNSGMSFKEIAKKHKLHHSTVANHIRDKVVPHKPIPKNLPKELDIDWEYAMEQRDIGRTYPDIAKELGCLHTSLKSGIHKRRKKI